MRETKVLSFWVSNDSLPTNEFRTAVWEVNVYGAELVASIGDGWQPISHSIDRLTDGLMLTILVGRETLVPDSVPASLSFIDHHDE